MIIFDLMPAIPLKLLYPTYIYNYNIKFAETSNLKFNNFAETSNLKFNDIDNL